MIGEGYTWREGDWAVNERGLVYILVSPSIKIQATEGEQIFPTVEVSGSQVGVTGGVAQGV